MSIGEEYPKTVSILVLALVALIWIGMGIVVMGGPLSGHLAQDAPSPAFVGEYDEETNEFYFYYSGSAQAFGDDYTYPKSDITVEYNNSTTEWDGATRSDSTAILKDSRHTIEVQEGAPDDVIIYVSHPDLSEPVEIDMDIPR